MAEAAERESESKGGSSRGGSRTATSPETQERVTALAKGRYAGFNHSHLTELLAKGFDLSRRPASGGRCSESPPPPSACAGSA